MAVAGSLTYSTEIDKSGFNKGLNSIKESTSTVGNQIKSIVSALGINKIISTAFNTITSSIDGAITRLDTLNNYVKVMQNLGASAEDADKSLNTLSDGLDGLPTALNDAASSVQRLMASNGDVNKATSYYLAMNDALLAGGTAAETQSAAMEQFLQMYSKGTVASQEWTSVLTAMPAQLQQVAESFGYTSTAVSGDFYTALKDGTISMDEFMDRLVLLDTEGTDSITSFSQQARDATSGISTATTNLKTRITKGVAEIIDSFDSWLQSEGFGSIAGIIDNIGTSAKNALGWIAEKLPDILDFTKEMLPYIEAIEIAFLSWKIGTTIQSAVQGFQNAKITLALFSAETNGASIAQNFFNGTLTLGETLVGLFTGKITLAELATEGLSKAQAILNAVMSDNPIALIVLAIGALIAIFVVLWNKCDWFREFWINLWEKIKNAVSTAIDFVVELFNKIINFVKDNWQGLLLFIANPFVGGFKLLYDNCEGFRNFINNFITNIKNFFVNGWNSIVTFFTEGIPNFISSVIEWLSELPYKIGYFIGQIIGNIINFGVEVWNWITVDLPEIIQGIIDWFAQLPDRIWEWLVNAYNNVIQWGTDTYNTATTWISNTIEKIVEWFSQLPSRIWNWLLNTYYNIVQWLSDTKTKMAEGVSNIVTSVVEWFSKLPDRMSEIGSNIVTGIWNGIVNAKDWLVGKVEEFASGILDGMKDALGIHSPSSKARDMIGKHLPEGVAVGIEANTDEALKAIDKMDDEIIKEMSNAVSMETGNINASATVKSNNSGYQMITVVTDIGDINMDGQKVGRVATPHIVKTMKVVGVTK